jgi:shikimate O-hydroxycinnamoyltransferase
MAEIIKEISKIIKYSNPRKYIIDRIKCMAIESALKGYLIAMIWIYPNNLKVNKDQFMPSEHLQSTLSNTLNYFPVLSGRMSADECENCHIHLTNKEVLFTESRCLNQNLNYFINQTDENKEFNYEIINLSDLSVDVSRDGTGPMLSIQITRLLCGSVILSISSFHCLMDVESVSNFINCWATHGKTLENRPTIERTFIEYSFEET